MIEVAADVLAKLEAHSHRPAFQVLHQKARKDVTWVPRNASEGNVIVHAVSSTGVDIPMLIYHTDTQLWAVGEQSTNSAWTQPPPSFETGGTTFTATGPAYETTLLRLPHRIFEVDTEVQAIFFGDEGSVRIRGFSGLSFNEITGIDAHPALAASPAVSVSQTLYSAGVAPRIYYVNNVLGQLEFITINAGTASTASIWDHGNSWTFYDLAPYAVTDSYGRDVLYFVAAALNGVGRTLFVTTYDPQTTRWTEPVEVFIFDVSNPANGIYKPNITQTHVGYALTYIKQHADSDTTTSTRTLMCRLSANLEYRWGPEIPIAPMSSVGTVITGRVAVEPDDYATVVVDDGARHVSVYNRYGLYHFPVAWEWHIAPGGTPITPYITQFNAQCSSDMTAGAFSFEFEGNAEGAPALDYGDTLHFSTGVIVVGNEGMFTPLTTGTIDSFDYNLADGNYSVKGREVSSVFNHSIQDDATLFRGTNRYVFIPTEKNATDLILPTQTDAQLATDVSIQLAEIFTPATTGRNNTVAYQLTATPFDECSAVEVGRYAITAPFSPAKNVQIEGIFELIPQITGIDSTPGIYCGADSDASVYYSFSYSTKNRKLELAVQRVLLTGISQRTVLMSTTIPPGGTTYTRIGLKMIRFGDMISCAYMTQNTIEGTQNWVENVFEYSDEIVASDYLKSPKTLSVEGYCGVVAFAPKVIGEDEEIVSVYLARLSIFSSHSPLTHDDVIRDIFSMAGFETDVESYGFKLGDPAQLGLAAGNALTLPDAAAWLPNTIGTESVLTHAGSWGLIRPQEQMTDVVATIVPYGDSESISLHTHMEQTVTTSADVSPLKRGFTGSGYGVTFAAGTGEIATYLGVTAPILWFWKIEADNTLTTLRWMYAPPWIAGIETEAGYLRSGKYLFAMQDFMLGVWVNDMFLGAFPVPKEENLTDFDAERAGYMWLTHVPATTSTADTSVREVYFSTFNEPVDVLTVNTGDSLAQIAESLMQQANADCALRSTLHFRLARADIERVPVITYSNRVLDATYTRSNVEWASHVRAVGKDGIYGDAYSMDRMVTHGKRFVQITDENLTTIQQCKRAAQKHLVNINRNETQLDASLVYDPRLERLDVIEYTVGDIYETVIVTDFSITAAPGDGSFVEIRPGTKHLNTTGEL